MNALLLKNLCIALLFTTLALAQDNGSGTKTDRVTLVNGDVLHGKIHSLIDGKLSFESPVLGVIEIAIDQIDDMVTATAVTIETKAGERLQRRITGLSGEQLKLGASPHGTSTNSEIPKAQLTAINPPAKKPETWTGSVSAGLYFASGNTDRRGGDAAINASRRTDQDRITAGASWNYAEDKSSGDWVLTQRRVQAALQYDYFLDDRSYILANTGVEGDRFQDIDLRFTAGMGYGYQWKETPDISFSTEVGVNYFSENFRSATPADNYVALRAAYTLRWQISEGVKFLQDVQFFPSLENADDVYAKKNSRLRLSLVESMFTELQWELDYDNTPSSGLDRIDNRFFLNVGWEF